MVGIARNMRGSHQDPQSKLLQHLSGGPPLASSESLASSSMINLSSERGVQLMSWDQFSRLEADCKVAEIRKLLPLVSWISEDVETVKRDMSSLASTLQERRNNRENVVIHSKEREDREIDTARTGPEEVSFMSTSSRLGGGPVRPTEISVSVHVMSDRSQDPSLITKARSQHKRVKLNVGGVRHEVMWKILENVPTSKLGMLAKVSGGHCNDWRGEN